MLTVWLTGLPAAGKTTLGDAVAAALGDDGHRAARIDGDVLRRGLCSDLGFSAADREENVRRAAHVAAMIVRQRDGRRRVARQPLQVGTRHRA